MVTGTVLRFRCQDDADVIDSVTGLDTVGDGKRRFSLTDLGNNSSTVSTNGNMSVSQLPQIVCLAGQFQRKNFVG